MHDALLMAVVAAITGAGVVTGLLFAFSNFVMRALAGLPAEHGMLAMQRINETILNPLFFVFFFGTPVLCVVVLAAGALAAAGAPGAMALVIGSLLYLVGPFGVTLLFNVPLNNRLASSGPSESETLWPTYQRTWQRWNHVRTGLGMASIAFLVFGVGRSHAF